MLGRVRACVYMASRAHRVSTGARPDQQSQVEQYASQAGKRLAGVYYAPAEVWEHTRICSSSRRVHTYTHTYSRAPTLPHLHTHTRQATPTDGAQPAPPQLLLAAEQMRRHYPGAVLVTVDNRALGNREAVPFHVRRRSMHAGCVDWQRTSHVSRVSPSPRLSPVCAIEQAHAKDGGSWSRSSSSVQVAQEGLAAFNRALSGGKAGPGLDACRSLVDMDEHLDDARKDFRNAQIQTLLPS